MVNSGLLCASILLYLCARVVVNMCDRHYELLPASATFDHSVNYQKIVLQEPSIALRDRLKRSAWVSPWSSAASFFVKVPAFALFFIAVRVLTLL